MGIGSRIELWRAYRGVEQKTVSYLIALARTERYNRVAVLGDADPQDLGLALRGVPERAIRLLLEAVSPTAAQQALEHMHGAGPAAQDCADARLRICDAIDGRVRRIAYVRRRVAA